MFFKSYKKIQKPNWKILSYSLSLSLSHTHTHTHTYIYIYIHMCVYLYRYLLNIIIAQVQGCMYGAPSENRAHK